MFLGKFKTERALLASIVVISLFIFASAFNREIGTSVSLAEEDNETSTLENGENSQDTEESQDDEGSQDNEESQDDEGSQEEESQDNEGSELSTSSTTSVQSMRTAGEAEEISEDSLDEVSQQSVDEVSEVSEPLVQTQEVSEESIKYVEGYGEVVSKEGNVALVKKGEKLFFFIPVEVESQVTLDEQGVVTDSKKSFLNWILSVFSF